MAQRPSRRSRWAIRGTAVAAVACLTAATAPLGLGAAQAAAAPGRAAAGPAFRLSAAQRTITVDRFGGSVFLDPGIYAIALGSRLQFDVRRASYTKPLTITWVTHGPG